MRTTTVLHPKNTILSCPECDRRIRTALANQSAICHARVDGKPHRATVMVPVADVADVDAAPRP